MSSKTLHARVKLGQPVSLGDVDGAIQEGALQGTLFPSETEVGRVVFEQIGTRRKRRGSRPQRRPGPLSARPQAA